LRYAIVFIPLLTIFIAFAISHIGRVLRMVAVIVVGLIMLANIGSNLQERVKPKMADLGLPPQIAASIVKFLNTQGIQHAFSDYWIAYQLTFYSKEKIISTSYPGFDRYPEYTQKVKGVCPGKVAYIYEKSTPSYSEFNRRLRKLNIKFKQKQIGQNIIYFGIKKKIF